MKYFLIIWFLLYWLLSIGQEAQGESKVLTLEKVGKSSGHWHNLKPEKNIRIWLKSGERITGKYLILDNNQIVIETDTIMIENIGAIKYTDVARKVVGTLLVIPGVIVIVTGVFNMIDAGCSNCIQFGGGFVLSVIGVIPTALGGSVLMGKKCKLMGDSWKLYVKDINIE